MERRRGALKYGLSVIAAVLLAAGTLAACSVEPAWFKAAVLEDGGVELVILEDTGERRIGFTDMARYGVLQYDGDCWRIRMEEGSDPSGDYAVGWADSTLGAAADPPSVEARPDLDVGPVAAGDRILFGGGEVPVERVSGFPDECLQGADGIVMINDARIPPE